jgi:hypothetical protein
MTRDRETAEADLIYDAVDRLWHQTDADAEGDRPSVTDTAIALETGIELDDVRAWLDEADGSRFRVGHYGDTRAVEAIIRD